MSTSAPTIHYDGPVTIAVGPSRTSKQWQNRELLWSKLVQRLAIPERTQETQAEYQNMRKQRRDEIKDVGGFVGGSLKGGRRKADAIIQRRLITLDLDSIPKKEDPWTIVSMIIGCAAVMYSTHSHPPDQPRLRIVIPLSRNVSPDEYAAISRRIAADIGIDMCDDTTYEPHRLMYWPSLPYDAEYKYEVSDGPWLDVDEQLQRYVDWRDPAEWPTSSRRAEVLRRIAKKQGNPLEKEGIVGAFCRAYSVEDAIEEFLPEVYRKCDDTRYTFLGGSTTGGLVVYDNGLFTYSHHGTDPTSGLLCNAFDLVRIISFLSLFWSMILWSWSRSLIRRRILTGFLSSSLSRTTWTPGPFCRRSRPRKMSMASQFTTPDVLLLVSLRLYLVRRPAFLIFCKSIESPLRARIA